MSIKDELNNYSEESPLDELPYPAYFEKMTTDAATGKHGLVDCNGKETVPAIFDSCKPCSHISECDSLAIVELDGKFYLTPRDGSGRLISQPFDEITSSSYFGWVKRDNKYGLVDIKSGKKLVPRVMDWIQEKANGYGVVFGNNGEIGYYDSYNDKYLGANYEAFDFTTRRFCSNGSWGWILRNGRHSHEAPENINDAVTIGLSLDDILRDLDMPCFKEDNYFTDKEAHDYWNDRDAWFDEHRNRPHDWYLELPALEIPKDIKADREILSMVKHSIGELKADSYYCALIRVMPTSNSEAPNFAIHFEYTGGMNLMTLSWRPKNRRTVWHDVQFKPTNKFHQVIQYGKEEPIVKFYRKFRIKNATTAVRFISYYYSTVWGIDASQWKTQLFEWTTSDETLV